MSTSRMSCASFPVKGVGNILEDGGEREWGESPVVGGFEVDGRRSFFGPGPLEVLASWT